MAGIADGDILTILTPERTQLKFRLDSIDAPDDVQEFSAAFEGGGSALTAGKTATLQVSGVGSVLEFRKTLLVERQRR